MCDFTTVKSHSNAPASNGNPPITEVITKSLEKNFFLLAITEIRLLQMKMFGPLKSVRAGVNCNLVFIFTFYFSMYLSCLYFSCKQRKENNCLKTFIYRLDLFQENNIYNVEEVKGFIKIGIIGNIDFSFGGESQYDKET